MNDTDKRIPIGLSIYGISYSTGSLGRGTDRENPDPLSPFEFLDLASGLGLSGVEVSPAYVSPDLETGELGRFREKAEDLGMWITTAGPTADSTDTLISHIAHAQALGSKILRVTLSKILCGDRRPLGGLDGWQKHRDSVTAILKDAAPEAEAASIRIGIENHQDAGSEDLVTICESVGSPNVGVTLDAGNPLAVGEDPLQFAERIFPHLVNVHLKDYRMFNTTSGYRLVHCPIGAGVVDFKSLFALLDGKPEVPRSIEMAALSERHIRILEDDYWAGFDPRDFRSVLPVLKLHHARGEEGEWRTPWETGEDGGIPDWEMNRLNESVRLLKGILES